MRKTQLNYNFESIKKIPLQILRVYFVAKNTDTKRGKFHCKSHTHHYVQKNHFEGKILFFTVSIKLT